MRTNEYYSGVLSEQSRQRFSEWLQSCPAWDSFATVTFARKQTYPLFAIKKVIPHLIPYFVGGFIGAEEHYLGGWHCHAILATGRTLQEGEEYWHLENRLAAIRRGCWEDLSRLGRFRQIGAIERIGGVSAYVTKYITKELAEWDIWGKNFFLGIDKL